jgi:hypothetical protein
MTAPASSGVRAERGVALPMAIFVVALLSGLIAAALLVVSSERRANDTVDAHVKAAAVAQSGLEDFTTGRSTAYGFTAIPPAAYESTRVTLNAGYADVVLQLIRPSVAGSSALYVIRSTGYTTRGQLSGVPQAQRTVTRYVRWQTGTMNVTSAWTSLTGLTKNGASGTLSGTDGCASSAAVAGVAVPTNPGYSQNGGSSVPSGNPPIDNLGTQAQADSSVHIDWNGIVNNNAITPDITIPPGSWPASFPASYWPVIRVNGDFALPGSGQGTLIVTGNMTISGAVQWNGILLVGGTLTSNGNNTVEGAVVTGLNVLLGQVVAASAVGNGTKTFQYNSCNVANALSKFSTMVTIPNAWADNWTTY